MRVGDTPGQAKKAAEEFHANEVIRKSLTYLAAPYSHPDKKVVESRMNSFKRAAALLTIQQYRIVSPLFFHDTLTQDPRMGGDWKFWEEYGKVLADRCGRIIVLTLPGWTSSTGLKEEIQHFRTNHKPVGFVEVNNGDTVDILWESPVTSIIR